MVVAGRSRGINDWRDCSFGAPKEIGESVLGRRSSVPLITGGRMPADSHDAESEHESEHEWSTGRLLTAPSNWSIVKLDS